MGKIFRQAVTRGQKINGQNTQEKMLTLIA